MHKRCVSYDVYTRCIIWCIQTLCHVHIEYVIFNMFIMYTLMYVQNRFIRNRFIMYTFIMYTLNMSYSIGSYALVVCVGRWCAYTLCFCIENVKRLICTCIHTYCLSVCLSVCLCLSISLPVSLSLSLSLCLSLSLLSPLPASLASSHTLPLEPGVAPSFVTVVVSRFKVPPVPTIYSENTFYRKRTHSIGREHISLLPCHLSVF